ncbi:MAG: thioredoxin [Phototrophicales bacterium]|nr:thioredoxin [Phototrophicales bacterium]
MEKLTLEVTEANFHDTVLSSTTPVLVDFWAEWCGPCKMIAPIVDELASDYEGKMVVGKLDADAHQGIIRQLGIMGIPTLILFKDGKPVVRITGFQQKAKIEKQLAPHIEN